MKRFIFMCLMVSLVGGCTCSKHPKPPEGAVTPDPNALPDYSGITVERVIHLDAEQGKGAEVKEGSHVTGRYGMWVYDPKQLGNKGKFLSRSEDAQPKTFVVGKGEVIKGWEQGVIGMKVGGKRSIIIPPASAYGEKGNEQVPANAIILVEFELMKVK